jgi:hypothetical protein
MNGPGFWMYETSGTLRPAVEAYLYNRPMTTGQITKMRQYLAQWINAPVWSDGPDIDHRYLLLLLTPSAIFGE